MNFGRINHVCILYILPIDFVFDPIVFGPEQNNLPLSVVVVDDTIPEPREQFTIMIGNVEIGNGRQGLTPQFSGSASIEIFDNDCEFGGGEYGRERKGREGRGGEDN